MQAGTDRYGRHISSRRERTIKRSRRRMASVALLTALALTAFAAPAQAGTGGAGTVAYDGTIPVGEDIVFSPIMRLAGATWYGPGFYGNETACGLVLQPGTIGVAHRNLPCGTAVKFAYRGRYLVTRVIDRGPFSKGNAWDLTNGARLALGFEGSGRLRFAVEMAFAKQR